jgi:membrane protein insertase Oxa1/YidC/SpoIIIJ
LVSLHLAAALPLYWLASSVVAYFQQARVLKEDVSEAEALVEEPASPPGKETKPKAKKPSSSKKKQARKRRRR